MDKVLKVIGAFVLVIATVMGLAILMAFPTKWVVNYLFTQATLLALFGVTQLTVWKALWLNFICASLFKSTVQSSK